ncbi:MAG: FAD-dependent oxidoreductase [Cyanobacteriota bacterium]|nr:FAD-dependent oxidoreductase [Cyanobacteriota bacterium]
MIPAIDAVDVLVWGGGTGGVAAAIQAARNGASTLLLTPGRWLGGMVSAAGVCCPDGNELTPWQTGLWGAFLRELERREPEGLDHNWVSCFGFRPATAEQILQEWARNEPRLLWWPRCRLLEVEREGSLISAVKVELDGEQRRVRCRIVIDGSDRGDLLPLAQAPFRLGWEPRELWGEPSAPSQQRLASELFFQEQPVQSPTWVVMGQLRTGRPGFDQDRIGHSLNQPLLPAPFERACQTFGLERTLSYGRLPAGLVMLNWPLHGNDWHRGLERAFSGDPSLEAELFEEMQAHSLGFAQALVKASAGELTLGHAFPTEAGSPAPWLAAMPYWREGRRMIGRSTVIEQDLLPQAAGPAIAPLPLNTAGELQAIAVGNYANDHHYPGPDWPLAPKSCRWGGRWTGTPFCIPYSALVSASIDNLLAADKAFSTSHMANGATRLQPLILNVGQAAGAAAAAAVHGDRSPAELAVRELQERLICDPVAPAALTPLWDTPWHHPEWRERQSALLNRPDLLAADGCIRCAWADSVGRPRDQIEGERHITRSSGRLHVTASGELQLETTDSHVWQLITLEPAINRILDSLTRGMTVMVWGNRNSAGGWIRVSRIDWESSDQNKGSPLA